ncbi:MAG: hypothetical protein ACLGSD_05580 [Acidobacteriota bacterium]
MASAEEFDRLSAFRPEGLRPEPLRTGFPGIHEVQPMPAGRETTPRAVGSPLPAGTGTRPQEYRAAPLGRSLAAPQEENGTQRAMAVLNQAMPFVQKLLPLIEGNLGAAIANVFAARPHAAPPVDLSPVNTKMADLQVQQAELRVQVQEQNTAVKRVEDQLEMVREATERNTLEQEELIEDLKSVGNKVNLFALLLFMMLLVSMLLNLALFLHMKQVLP